MHVSRCDGTPCIAAMPRDRPAARRFSAPATAIYVLLHAGCLGAVWTGITAEALAIFSGAFVLRALGVSVVYHRYFAHKSYRVSRPVQFLLGVYGALTVMGGLLWWAQTHRWHHQHADTADDIHSPRYQGFIYSHCGWFLAHSNRVADLTQVPDLARFRELVWIERWDAAFKLVYIGCCYTWFGAVGVVWGFFLPTVVVLHMVHWIQSVSHSVGGYRRYPVRDNSRNHWLFGVLSLGEGFHHNHHCFPDSARMGLRWWEIDAGYATLVLLSWLGLVRELRAAEEVRGPGSRVDRYVVRVCSELRAWAERVDRELVAFASERHGEAPSAGIEELRRRTGEDVDALAASSRELLIRGSFAMEEAMAELQQRLRRRVRAALLPVDPALYGEVLRRLDAAAARPLSLPDRAGTRAQPIGAEAGAG